MIFVVRVPVPQCGRKPVREYRVLDVLASVIGFDITPPELDTLADTDVFGLESEKGMALGLDIDCSCKDCSYNFCQQGESDWIFKWLISHAFKFKAML